MEPGAIVGERFEIVRRAAMGGMGAVYAARDRTTGALAAIKVVHVDAHDHVERLRLEARALAQLDHPNVVRYLAHGMTDEGDAFVAMDWIEGESLSARLKRQPLSVSESVGLAIRTADALGHAHAKGIVHRDVKPGNLVLRGDDPSDVVLVDFGIARSATREELTRTGMILGTPAFMSPEQARGIRRLEPSSDVFALGCVLFRCLTGRNAFVADEPLAIVVKILLDDPPAVETIVDVDPELAQLVARLLSKDPARRPKDGAAVAEALRRIAPRTEQDVRRAPKAPERLTLIERRLVSLVLTPTENDPEATLSGDELHGGIGRLRAVASRYEAASELLPNGTFVAALSGRASASEQATAAARCAIELKEIVRGAPLVIVTGRATVDASDTKTGITHTQTDAFEAAARQVSALREAHAHDCIVIDETTAGLLDQSFVVGPHDNGLELRGLRADVGETPRLLGKVIGCVGRDRELATLEATLAECERESISRVALVTAPPGTGKSRVLREFRGRAHERVTTFYAQADAFAAGSPHALLAQLLRSVAGIDAHDTDVARARKLRARIGRHVAMADVTRVAEFLGEIVGILPPEGPSAPLIAARADPPLMAQQVRSAWTTWLAAECEAAPVLVVLDDVHWADASTMALVGDTLDALPEASLCFALAARPEALGSLPKALVDRVVHVTLGALSRKSSERLVREALGDVDATAVGEIVARAGGHPLVLEELVRAHAQGHQDRGATAAVAMVQSRLESLDPECRRVLRAASVFGEVFWLGGVEHLVSSSVGAQIDQAITRELVTRRPSSRHAGDEELAFRHALVKDAAYAMLTSSDAALGHRLAGEWLVGKPDVSPWSLAEHFARSDQPARALPHLRRAAEQALEAGDFVGAIGCVARAQAIGVDGDDAAALLILDADAKRWLGMSSASESSALAAMGLLQAGSASWLAAARLALFSAGNLVRIDTLHKVTAEVCGVEVTPENERAWFLAAGQAAGIVMTMHFAPARELRARIEQAWRPELEADLVLSIARQNALLSVALYEFDWMRVLETSRACLEQSRRIGDARLGVFSEINVMLALAELGDYEGALESHERGRAMATKAGLSLPLLTIDQNHGYVLMCLGRLEEARAIQEGLARRASASAPRVHNAALACLVRVLVRLGDLDAALTCASEALRTTASEAAIWRIYPLAAFAEALNARGEHARALEAAREAHALVAEIGGNHFGNLIAGIAATDALLALGREEEAKHEIERHAARVRACAAAVPEKHRRAMLERVMDNRRTLELAARFDPASR